MYISENSPSPLGNPRTPQVQPIKYKLLTCRPPAVVQQAGRAVEEAGPWGGGDSGQGAGRAGGH